MFEKIDKIIPNKLKKYIPNTITVGRLFMTLGFVSSFLSGNMPASVVLFASASISDAIDGHLARKWNVQSKFGKYVDPFADKLLVGSALLLYGTINPTMYITLVGELSIAFINILSVIKKKKVEVNKEGKLKTILLMSTTSLGLLSTLFNSPTFNKIVSVLALFNIPFQGATLSKYAEQLFRIENEECTNNNEQIKRNDSGNTNLKNSKSTDKNNELDVINSKIKKLKEEKSFLVNSNKDVNKKSKNKLNIKKI